MFAYAGYRYCPDVFRKIKHDSIIADVAAPKLFQGRLQLIRTTNGIFTDSFQNLLL